MSIWALSDPHLAFGNPEKTMELFGPTWKSYPENIEKKWNVCVSAEDLVLIPGDISWAMKMEEALVDLEWVDKLPGQKLIIRGNHDYWWPSSAKLKKILPPSISFIHNSVYSWNGVDFAGSRLWDTVEYSFDQYIEFQENPKAKAPVNREDELEKNEKIFARELERLERSLKQLPSKTNKRIALTHYPPIGADLSSSKASTLLEQYEVDICVFGHLHNVRANSLPFGKARGVEYVFASCDYLGFAPLKVL